jgi:hypothetical protein
MHPHHVVTLHVRLPSAPSTSCSRKLIPLLFRTVVFPVVGIHFVRTASPIGSTQLSVNTARQARVACPHTPAPPVGSMYACLPFRTSLSSASYGSRPSPVVSRAHGDHRRCRRPSRSRYLAGAVSVGISLRVHLTSSLGGRSALLCFSAMEHDVVWSIGDLYQVGLHGFARVSFLQAPKCMI